MRVFEVWGDLIRDGMARFKRAWGWMVAQFAGLALLIALGIVWTRIPERYGWQVALTFVVPLVILAGFLWLQAGTMRAWLRPERVEAEDAADSLEQDETREPRRVRLWWGALTLIVWIVIGWVAWWGLDHLDLRGGEWSGYVNSKLGPHARATWGSYNNVYRDFEWGIWTLRWVVAPGLLIPLAVCSAAGGLLRMRWRRGLRVWRRWSWWPVVLAWALIAEAWPRTWFNTQPHGTVHEQVWRVVLKIAAAYLLAVLGWNKVLGWAAMLVDPRPRTLLDEPYLRLGLGLAGASYGERAIETESAAGRKLEVEAAPEAGSEAAPKLEAPSNEGIVGRPLPHGGEDAGGNS